MVAGNGPQDYPDWVRLQQQAAPLSFFISQQATVTPVSGNWIYVGAVSHLIINMSTGPAGVLAKAVFLFADDNAGTNATHKTSAWCDLTHPTRAIIPIMGNWMRITTSSNAADGSGQGLAMYGEGVTYVPRPGLIADPSDGIHTTSNAVAIGATVTVPLPRTTPGDWQYVVTAGGAGFIVETQQEFVAGTFHTVSRIEGAGLFTIQGRVALVAAPTQLTIQNTSGAVNDFRYSMQAIG